MPEIAAERGYPEIWSWSGTSFLDGFRAWSRLRKDLSVFN